MTEKITILAVSSAPMVAAASAAVETEWIQYGALGLLGVSLFLAFRFATDLVKKLDSTIQRIDSAILAVGKAFRTHDERREEQMRDTLNTLSKVIVENTKTLGSVEATMRRCPGTRSPE